MYEYNMFVNKYYNQFKREPTYEEYEHLKSHIENIFSKMFAFNTIEFINPDKTLMFSMYMLLKKYDPQEILSGRHDLEIENSAKYYDAQVKKTSVTNVNIHPSKKYIYDILVSIKDVIEDNINLNEITNRIYSQLKHLGFKDEDILNEECDYAIIEQLRGNGIGIAYTQEFTEYRKKIEIIVSKIFTNHKLDAIRNNPTSVKHDMSYQFYNSSYHQMNTAYKSALSFYLSGYDLDKIDRKQIESYVNNYIVADMIKINSTTNLKEQRLEETRYKTQEEQAYIDKLNKQKAAIWAIILSGIMVGNIFYSAIMNMPTKAEREKRKETSSQQDTNELFSKIENKLNQLSYDMENNTFSLGGN